MSRRTSIVKAIADKLKTIDGSSGFKSNVFGNAYPYLKFWDEVSDFPCVYTVAGAESREYQPGNFTWGFLNVSIKVYVKGEDAQQLLEDLLEDVETVIDNNRVLPYETSPGYETTEILISSITTDEGLLAPYGVGEINLQVRYQIV
jgi:hypothetical protein